MAENNGATAAVISHIREEMDRASVDMITATSQLQMDANAVRQDKPNWKSYLQ
jgi:hypothetical protein